jgi:hypothetical protein
VCSCFRTTTAYSLSFAHASGGDGDGDGGTTPAYLVTSYFGSSERVFRRPQAAAPIQKQSNDVCRRRRGMVIQLNLQ